MAVDVETLVVKLEGRVTDFERAMTRAQRSAQAASAKITGTFTTMNRHLSGLFRGGLAVAGVVGLASLPRVIGDIVKEAGKLVDTADKIGVTTRQLQQLKFAAGQTGVEFGDLTGGLSFFNRQIGEASRSQGDLFEILKANGVAIRDQAGNVRPLIDLLFDYADLVKNAASQEERATLVTKAFGRSSDELINTLAGGAASLRAYGAEAERTGQLIEDGLLRDAEAIGDRWEAFMGRLTTSWQSFVLRIVTGTVDARNAIDRFLQESAKKDDPFGEWLRGLQSLGKPGGIPALPGGLGASPAMAAPGVDPAAAARARATESLQKQLFDLAHLVPKPTVLPNKEGDAAADAVKRVTAALALEGAQLARTARDQEIYNALNQAGVDIASKAGQAIAAQAGANFDLAQAIAGNIEQMDLFRDAASEALSTFISDLREGKRAAEALTNVMQGLIDKLLNRSFDLVLDTLLGKQGTSASGIIGSLLGGGRAGGGPVSAGVGYAVGERGPELFVPNVSGRIVPGSGVRGGAVVQLFDQRRSGAPIEQRRSQGPNGETVIRMIVRDELAAGGADSSLRGRFGMTPLTRKVTR